MGEMLTEHEEEEEGWERCENVLDEWGDEEEDVEMEEEEGSEEYEGAMEEAKEEEEEEE